jgi:DNA-binding GntR family transcriptional regulator
MADINDTNSSSNNVVSAKKRIQRQSLHLEVADNLRDMIVEGALPPGQRISEGDLCEQFGISRTPMREALKVLASEGLVEIKPNRGTRVSEITLEDIDELFEAVSGIERLCGELATEKMSEGNLEQLKSLHERMTNHFKKGQRHDYFRLNQETHNLIVQLSGNSVLREIHANIMIKVRRARYLAILSVERWEESVREHAGILEAMEARDVDLVGKRIWSHVYKTGEIVKQTFSTENSTSGKPPLYANGS